MDMPSPHTLTLREAFERFYVGDLQNPRTIEHYRTTLNRWEQYSANPPVGSIDNRMLQEFRDRCVEAGLAPGTINGTWRNLRALFRRLGPQEYRNPLGLGIIERVPWMKLLREERDYPRIATFAELNAIYDACEHAAWPQCDVPPCDWWRCLIVLAYNCGARIGDLIRLSPHDISFIERLLRFRARKTKKKQQIPLNSVALAHIERIWSTRERLFPGAYKRGLYDEWKRLQQIAGIDPPLTFHALRKTCGTRLAESSGLDAAGYVLGHNQEYDTTTRYYINAIGLLREALNQIPQPDAFLRILADPTLRANVARDSRRVFRSEWLFGHGVVAFRGRPIAMPRRPLAVLRALVTSGRPLSLEQLLRVCWPWDETVSPTTAKTTLHQVRVILSNALKLPAGWDPIPPQGERYIVSLPPNL